VSAALDLLDQFRAIGAEIVNRDGRLVLRSEHPIPAPMVAAAKLAKGELLVAVAGQGAIRESASVTEPTAPTATDIPENRGKAPVQPVLMCDGRRLWRFRAESIPKVLDDNNIRPAVEARWCGCTLVADGLDLMVAEPWMSELPEEVRDGLAANAGTIIALLRGESRVRNCSL
jgi:hypothetical protein